MIPLYKPYMPELPELDQILMSGNLSYGQYTKEFEQKLKKYFGADYLFVTNSFNTAISVVVTTLGLGFGDEIIASPMACLASTQPYASSGLDIKWADIDSARGTLDPKSVEMIVTSKTKAIIHNHFCGYPGYIDEINDIGLRYGIPIIDDGIECFGSEYKGKKIGNCGTDVTVFSLTAVRIPNAIDGGVVVFKNKKLYEKALLIRDCGIDRKKFRDNIGEINPCCDISLIGYSATMSNVNGYIGARQMDCVDNLIRKQRQNAMQWQHKLEDLKGIDYIKSEDILPNYWVFGLLSDRKRNDIIKFRNNGFYASGVHIDNTVYSVFGDRIQLAGVTDFYNKFLALPCGWWYESC